MYVVKTWEDGQWVAWSSGANPSNINKLVDLHRVIRPGVPYMVDKVE